MLEKEKSNGSEKNSDPPTQKLQFSVAVQKKPYNQELQGFSLMIIPKTSANGKKQEASEFYTKAAAEQSDVSARFLK